MENKTPLEELLLSEQRTELLPYFVMNNFVALYGVNRCFHAFFKPEILKRLAPRLLSFVLSGDMIRARVLIKNYPEILFIETTAEVSALGFDKKTDVLARRRVQLTPLRAMAATGDKWMINYAIDALANYRDKITNETGYSMAVRELKLQFPDGFNRPPCAYDFDPLIQAISEDHQLIATGEISENTKALIEKFKQDFSPGDEKSGYFFNLNVFLKALELFDDQDWQDAQDNLYFHQVLEYLGRFFPAVYIQMLNCANIYRLNLNNIFKLSAFSYRPFKDDTIAYALSYGILNVHGSFRDFIYDSEKYFEELMSKLQPITSQVTCAIL